MGRPRWRSPRDALAFVGGLGFRGWCPQLLVALALLILGSGLEIAQVVVPGRTASPYDGLANLVGIVLGSLLVVGVDALRLRRSHAIG